MDHEQKTGHSTDLLVCCGDFQSLRNPADFHSTSIPPKYQDLGTFPKYYSGESVAPILTIFIGGNHEAGQPLRELYYGGWVAPRIYYLGACGVVSYRGIRIGGISGIYKSFDYTMGHHERFPLDRRAVKSIYHVRNVDVERAKRLAKSSPLDVFVSHDWPQGIEQHGNTSELIRRKPYFRDEIERNDLGSPANRDILNTIQPKHWFSAHLHVMFHATVVHGKQEQSNSNSSNNNPSKSDKPSNLSPTSSLLTPSQATKTTKTEDTKLSPPDSTDQRGSTDATPTATQFHGMESSTQKCIPSMDDDENMEMNKIEDLTEQMTKFFALDKCLPRRKFLSILNIRVPEAKDTPTGSKEGSTESKEYHLEYDPEWLAILKNTHHWTQTEHRHVSIPPYLEEDSNQYHSVDWIKERFREATRNVETTSSSSTGLEIPRDFVPTVPYHTDEAFQSRRVPPLPVMGNPQTDRLLQVLELDHVLTVPYDPDLTPGVLSALLQGKPLGSNSNINNTTKPIEDANEIDIESEESEGNDEPANARDDNEIDIDSDEDDKDAKVNHPVATDTNEIEIDIDDDDEESDEDTSSNSITKKARLEE